MEHGLRLITTDATPALELARTLEALLVVASQPLPVDELAAAAEADPSQVEESLSILEQRFSEERSGIVLEHVAGGWAFRASKTASDACARLFEKPAERGLSQAALETLAIVAYLGPVSRPEITRIRGVNVDGVVAGLVERGLVTEGGRDNEFGAIRYRTTPLFERIFGLESLAALPRVEDLAAAAQVDVLHVAEALEILSERYCEENSGIVLELVAGGWAFRASGAASEACARLFEKPVEKGLSQAALETLAIVAYLGPMTRPEVARIRGVNVDGVIAGLVERGLIAEGGRENEFGAIRYRTTPLFERIFGLESLAALPRVDDLGADVTEIRERLEAVAEKRPA